VVQIVENRSLLDCRLVRVVRAGDWFEAEVIVERSTEVEGIPNLIQPGEAVVTIRLKEPVFLPPRFRIEVRRSAPAVIWGDPTTLVELP
jgi:hypothetical protein